MQGGEGSGNEVRAETESEVRGVEVRGGFRRKGVRDGNELRIEETGKLIHTRNSHTH